MYLNLLNPPVFRQFPIEIANILTYNVSETKKVMRLEIEDLLKKQQLKKLKQDSDKNSKAKYASDQKEATGLAARRKQLNMSIPQISLLTGIDQITLKRWETNGMTPDDNVTLIQKYAKVMHLDFQKLISKIVG